MTELTERLKQALEYLKGMDMYGAENRVTWACNEIEVALEAPPALTWSAEPTEPGRYLRCHTPTDPQRWLSDFTDRLPSPSDRFGLYAGPIAEPQEGDA